MSSDSLIGKRIDDQPVDNIPNQIKNQLKSTNQIKTNPIKSLSKGNENVKIEIQSFQDLIDRAEKEKEIFSSEIQGDPRRAVVDSTGITVLVTVAEESFLSSDLQGDSRQTDLSCLSYPRCVCGI